MDSSPDLSLKLRRGSSDSRDSFYMDFAQGIDSDIEEVDTRKGPAPNSSVPPGTLPSMLPIEQQKQLQQQKEQQALQQLSVPSDSDLEEGPPSPSPPPPPPPPPPLLLTSIPAESPVYPIDSELSCFVPMLPPLPLSPLESPSPPSIQEQYDLEEEQQQQYEKQIQHSQKIQQQQYHQHSQPPPNQYQFEQLQPEPEEYHHEHEAPLSPQLEVSPPETPEEEIMSVVAKAPHTETDIKEDVDNGSVSEITIEPTPDQMPSSSKAGVGVVIPPDTSSAIEISPVPQTPVSLEESTVTEIHQHQHPPPSPMSSGNILVSSETVSHTSSPAKSSRVHSATQSHRVTIDESKLPLSASSTHHQLVTIATGPPSGSSSQQHLATASVGAQTGHLALMYHSHHHHHLNYPVLPIARRPSRLPEQRYFASKEIKAGDALATTFSALYGKLLVVMGIAFPMAEVISTYIPPSFYEGFYLYLYIGSMVFLFFMYATLLWGRPKIISPTGKSKKKHSKQSSSTSASESMEESDTESGSCEGKRIPPAVQMRRPSILAPLGRQHHYGSFYLRMGAVAFGIGSMIYSGLEFGQYFELERDTKCHNVMMALTPATRMAFIFIQMYFIFLNNEQIKVYRHKILARFGLMHMIGTNLSVWLNVLIQETKHEILTFYNPENRTLRISHRLGHRMHNLEHTAHLRVSRGLKGPYQIFECRRTNIIGTLVQDASPFLFPCTIEYSLICAAILYVMWRSISRPTSQTPVRVESGHSPCKRSPHHYSVDCARAHKGLFIGILILVLTIISLILFFVLISRPEFVSLAVTEVTICELTIYATATIATLIGMVQVRHLQYDAARSFQLDDILLVGAQTGSFLYSTFTVIGGHFTLRRDTVLVLITALASIVQTAFQTMFILDASRRQAVSPEHIRKKPGREIVTFMLVANLAMWAISTLEKSRAESHPIQLNFYGLWAWTIITHVSMPLAIFYRFHSTVCLCEIWKRAYKLKPAYM